MQIDIIIFAVITLLLVLKLKSILGTRDDKDDKPLEGRIILKERSDLGLGNVMELKPDDGVILDIRKQNLIFDENLIKSDNLEEVKEGLNEIAEVDKDFDIRKFIEGAKYAFEVIVSSYGIGDKETLKDLLSPKLYADFESAINHREEQGHSTSASIEQVKQAIITAASLRGTMAYITIDYDVEKNTTVKDESGEDESNSSLSDVHDIWTFTRDTRSEDPNWILIETKAA